MNREYHHTCTVNVFYNPSSLILFLVLWTIASFSSYVFCAIWTFEHLTTLKTFQFMQAFGMAMNMGSSGFFEVGYLLFSITLGVLIAGLLWWCIGLIKTLAQKIEQVFSEI